MKAFYAGFEAGQAPVHVTIGQGARHELAAVLDAMGLRRAIVLTTPEQEGQGEEIRSAIGHRAAGLFAGATMHTPIHVTEAAIAALGEADCVVAIGGGSTIGLGKAIAYRTDLPQIVLPTTYAGSEATPILGQTQEGRKETLRSARVQPEAIIYDSELLASLPVHLSVVSGLNAMAHALEALYSKDANPLSDQLALAGIRAFAEGLERVVADPRDLVARETTQFGSWLCGTVLAQVGMALHHKLCHTLGGMFNLPHAETHAILLPHSVAYNEVAAADQLAPAARLLRAPTAAQGLYELARRLGAPLALKEFGVSVGDLDRAVDAALANPYWNPRPLQAGAIKAMLSRALEGAAPQG